MISFNSLFIIFLFYFFELSYNQIILDSGVPESDIKVILNKHNNLRNLIANGNVPGQPQGENIKTMKWDAKLASEAQLIANSCRYAHVRVRDSRWSVGQNLHRKRSTKLNNNTLWESAIQHWFDEHKLYQYSNTSIKGTGHYTQLIWATTEYLGCGYSYFYAIDQPLKYTKLYVCNYGPRGNIVGVKPYVIKKETDKVEN